MRARTAVLLIILAALAVFAALNWTAIVAPTTIHLLFTQVEAPVGLVLLAVAAALTVLYAVFITWIEASALREIRGYTRELQAQRQLADNAEASRYAELRSFLVNELAGLRAVPDGVTREVLTRLDRLETQVCGEIERSGNSLSAYFAELEDRLNRGERPAPPRPS
jgi:uncharacterized integral membrane protein